MTTQDDAPAIANPRRYAVKVDVGPEAVGPLFSLLIREIEQPKLAPAENGNHRISLVCMLDQLPTIVGIIVEHAVQLYVGPYIDETKVRPATFVAPRPVHVQTPLQADNVRRFPMKRSKNSTGSKVKDSPGGRAMLSAFADGKIIKHPADFTDALAAAGFAVGSWSALSNKLTEEGSLVRIGRGAYRLPTLADMRSAPNSSGESPGSTGSAEGGT